jgi:hypothetical protein
MLATEWATELANESATELATESATEVSTQSATRLATKLTSYRATQIGWVVIGGSTIGLVVALVVTLSLSPATRAAVPWMIVAMFGVLLAGLALYSTLTVEVDAEEIRVRFGVGIIRRAIPLDDVLRCDIVRTPMRWGWGLHWTPSGWLYNVGGRAAVRIEMKRQRPLMIGSEEAEQLKAAIDARIAARGH